MIISRSVWSIIVLLASLSQAPANAKTITVAQEGAGDFTSVQAAIDSIPANNTQPVTIHIKPGTYKERVRVPRDKPFVTLLGDDAKTTILTYDLHAKSVLPATTQPVGTSGSYSTLIEANDFTAENLTFENPSGHIAQAVALRTTGQRQAFFSCRMLGGQDTLYLHDGLAYFKDCYMEGRVDFIFGRGVAVFEDCHIHSKNGGYITAAATEPDKEFGYLFLNCKLTGEGDKAFLGRPWRPHAAVAFINCQIGEHIKPEGWDNWRNPENEKTARYVEYGNTGKGADTRERVPWAKQLTREEAAKYTVENVLGGWKPLRPSAGKQAQGSRPEAKVKIVLVGDSTVTDKAGWGAGFKSLLNDDVECVNLSKGGRSSKSYRNEGWWDKAMAEKGDYVLIQFGHNDQPGKGPERATDPKTDFRANLKRYVEEARAAGAAPVLVTSLTRRHFNPDGTIRDTLEDYAKATKAVAAETGAPLIDLHERSIALCESLGPEKCKAFNPPPQKEGQPDVSHLNAEGSRTFAALVVEDLARLVPELRAHLKGTK
ncbi:MAG TPA: pectinesterase family protein [Tepidisphaeraceae bacterium]|nr:pectinesterase family protein [Tepidisphaeraceae bacterium]